VPYPLAPGIAFRDFRDILTVKYTCRFAPLPVGYSPRPLTLIERDVGGATLDAITDLADNEQMLPSQIRSICSRLQIDPADFGFVLG